MSECVCVCVCERERERERIVVYLFNSWLLLFLGDALSQRRVHQRSVSSLPELPSVNKSKSLSLVSIVT